MTELEKLKDRLFNNKNGRKTIGFHADVVPGTDPEVAAKAINDALDQIENGTTERNNHFLEPDLVKVNVDDFIKDGMPHTLKEKKRLL